MNSLVGEALVVDLAKETVAPTQISALHYSSAKVTFGELLNQVGSLEKSSGGRGIRYGATVHCLVFPAIGGKVLLASVVDNCHPCFPAPLAPIRHGFSLQEGQFPRFIVALFRVRTPLSWEVRLKV